MGIKDKSNDIREDLNNITKRPKLKNDLNIEILLAKKNLSAEEFSIAVNLVGNDPINRLKLIGKQLGYYFCNDNLARDSFYSNRFREDSIKYDKKNVMEIKYVQSARRMLLLNADINDIEKAIELYDNSGLKIIRIDDVICIQRLEPIPPLIRSNNNKNKCEKFGDTLDTMHVVGCLVYITEIPLSYEGWQQVKEELARIITAKICYISPISENRSCFSWVGRFNNDVEIIKNLNNTPFKVTLIESMELYNEMLKNMKPNVMQIRAKEMQRIQHAAISRPFQLNELTFRNFAHLRKLLKELLDKSVKGSVIQPKSTAEAVLTAVIKFHPRADEKLKIEQGWHIDGFKVDMSAKGEEGSKCFFVKLAKQDQVEYEDFSITKCLMALRNLIHTLPKATSPDVIIDTLITNG